MIRIAGVDEVGRGPLAGPVVAAAVLLPSGYTNDNIKDSKKLSAKKREYLYNHIIDISQRWAIVAVGSHRIDLINIREATRLAMKIAVNQIDPTKTLLDNVLIDGNTRIDIGQPQETIIKGDQKHIQISAASIIAKVWRDRLMIKLGEKYPGYGFETHAGYPTADHRKAIANLGPCPIHRRTFAGVKEWLQVKKFQHRKLGRETGDSLFEEVQL